MPRHCVAAIPGADGLNRVIHRLRSLHAENHGRFVRVPVNWCPVRMKFRPFARFDGRNMIRKVAPDGVHFSVLPLEKNRGILPVIPKMSLQQIAIDGLVNLEFIRVFELLRPSTPARSRIRERSAASQQTKGKCAEN